MGSNCLCDRAAARGADAVQADREGFQAGVATDGSRSQCCTRIFARARPPPRPPARHARVSGYSSTCCAARGVLIADGGLSDSKQRTAEATTHQIGGGDAHHGGIDLRRARRGDDLPEMIGNRDWDAYHRWEHAGKVLHRSGGESGRGALSPQQRRTH